MSERDDSLDFDLDFDGPIGDDTSEFDGELELPELDLELNDTEEDGEDPTFYMMLPGEDMDGDFDTGMASAGFGTDEDYGCYGGDEE